MNEWAEPPVLLRVVEVARRLGISRSQAYVLVRQLLPHVRLGRSLRVPRPALDKWIEDHTEEGTDTYGGGHREPV
jgi:excisionase family DNA binding protein